MIDAVQTAMADDHELAVLIVAGEESAIKQVRGWIRGAATPYRASLYAELDDLEQEVLVALVVDLREGAFEGRSSLSTYVRRMMVFRCINHLRDRRRRATEPIDDFDLCSEKTSPLEAASASERISLALRIQSEMPQQCRVLWRMLLDGLGYQAMATAMNLNAGTVRVRALRCRRSALQRWHELTEEEL